MTFRERKDLHRTKKVEHIEPVYVEIGARIRWLRQQRDWDREQIADRLGVHKGTITAWELAQARVRLSELVRLAHAFGVPLEVFLTELRVEDSQPTEHTLASRAKQSKTRKKTTAAKKAVATTKPKKKK